MLCRRDSSSSSELRGHAAVAAPAPAVVAALMAGCSGSRGQEESRMSPSEPHSHRPTPELQN